MKIIGYKQVHPAMPGIRASLVLKLIAFAVLVLYLVSGFNGAIIIPIG